ncbi:DUF3866 family protein [Halanaerobaculum tunisiense]
MIETREGQVLEILEEDSAVTKVELLVEGQNRKAINYNQLTGPISRGDQVVVNTTAVSLDLGTGGWDFVLWIKGCKSELQEQGHIMKLRYTPYQLQTCSLAEEESPHYQAMQAFTSLEQTPVVVGTLHSMLPAIVTMARARKSKLKIAYIMTDGAALPIKFSNLVDYLTEVNLIDATITSGHAFGGDLEAVNIYSALIGAYQVVNADLIVVTMGPGIVGTGTKYGFSGTEQADILHAVTALAGRAIAVPRVSFAATRERHYGLSHHSQTNLGELTLVECILGLPKLAAAKRELLRQQVAASGLAEQHQIIYQSGAEIIPELQKLDCNLTTMGRDLEEAKEYFITAGIAGKIAAENK